MTGWDRLRLLELAGWTTAVMPAPWGRVRLRVFHPDFGGPILIARETVEEAVEELERRLRAAARAGARPPVGDAFRDQ